MKIVLVSFFKSNNLGDLLISDALLKFCATFGETSTLSYSDNPLSSSTGNRVEPASGPTRVPWRTAVRGGLYRLGFKRTGKFLSRDADSPWQLKEVLEQVGSSDLMVIGGGNMIFDIYPWSESWAQFEAAVRSAVDQGIGVVAVGLGIGPFVTDRQHRQAARVLDLCRRVSFRDQASLDLYRKYSQRSAPQGELTIDPVLALEPPGLPVNVDGPVAVNILDPTLAGWGRLPSLMLARSSRRLLQQLLESVDNDVILFSTDASDYPFLRRLAASIDSHRCQVVEISGLDEVEKLFATVSVVVAARMHSLILAATREIPIVGIVWQPKVASFLAIAGHEADGVSMSELERQVPTVISLVQDKLSNQSRERSRLRRNISLIRSGFDVNRGFIKQFSMPDQD